MNIQSRSQRHTVAIPRELDPVRHRIIAAHVYGLEHRAGRWCRLGDVAGRILARLDPERHEKAA